jgi:hypothetical protein
MSLVDIGLGGRRIHSIRHVRIRHVRIRHDPTAARYEPACFPRRRGSGREHLRLMQTRAVAICQSRVDARRIAERFCA